VFFSVRIQFRETPVLGHVFYLIIALMRKEKKRPIEISFIIRRKRKIKV